MMRSCVALVQNREGGGRGGRATWPLRHTRYLQELLRVCGRVEEGEIRKPRRRSVSGEWPACRLSPAAVAATSAPVLLISRLTPPPPPLRLAWAT
ncbi:hypothetical protein E2C01_055019 [Portunus trituberculatus]|uniref:Uncharacterized protein n=1 Tax=Portunus trituberculatus TaxID=210409 RepID=A0A5B7GUT9_PORTR|nr:hypothetical protein [Portunus trituberculatus]